MIQENQEVGAEPEVDAGESAEEVETIPVSKKDYEKLNQTIGSLKRENKDFKKKLEDFNQSNDTPQKNEKKPHGVDLGELAYHNTKSEGVRITHDDDVEFLRSTLEETGKSQKDILATKWFQEEIKARQEARLVVNATPTGNRRSGGQVNELEVAYTNYIQGKGLPSDPELRQQVVNKRQEREKMASQFTSTPIVE